MSDTDKLAVFSVLRSILIAVGTILVGHGIVNDAQWSQLLGAITAGAPIVWGVWEKYRTEAKTQVRVTEAYNAGTTSMPVPDKAIQSTSEVKP